jgi:hypothetical protein
MLLTRLFRRLKSWPIDIIRRLIARLARPGSPVAWAVVGLAKVLRVDVPGRPYLHEGAPGQVNPLAVMSFVMMGFVLRLWLLLAAPLFRNASSIFVLSSGTGTDRKLLVAPDSTLAPVGPAVPVATATPTPSGPTATPTPSGPTATPTPSGPTATPALLGLAYSYYYPPLGPPNCHSANWSDDGCADVTASGLPWSKWLGRAVALHPDMLAACPLGSVLRVYYPDVIAGDYLVLDVCPGCASDNRYWVDFLARSQVLDWGYPVVASCLP